MQSLPTQLPLPSPCSASASSFVHFAACSASVPVNMCEFKYSTAWYTVLVHIKLRSQPSSIKSARCRSSSSASGLRSARASTRRLQHARRLEPRIMRGPRATYNTPDARGIASTRRLAPPWHPSARQTRLALGLQRRRGAAACDRGGSTSTLARKPLSGPSGLGIIRRRSSVVGRHLHRRARAHPAHTARTYSFLRATFLARCNALLVFLLTSDNRHRRGVLSLAHLKLAVSEAAHQMEAEALAEESRALRGRFRGERSKHLVWYPG